MELTPDMFKEDIDKAMATYDKYVVCLDKTPEACLASLQSLMEKAINQYANRGPNLRHGIALDRHVTIILSQTDHTRPLCGIYFNLSSPYQKKGTDKKARAQ
ncbi:MAG: hypothetical protein FJ404_13360 [Verrucomicrobia bacterium]|nr:hypothetical protein [Verrucomicrobiota bacterium]